MNRRIVHFVLGLLICLMSLQGMAASLSACGAALSGEHGRMPAALDTGHGGEHGSARHAVSDSAARYDADAMDCAGYGASCGAPALLPDPLPSIPAPHASSTLWSVTCLPADHVPDAPERPPRHHPA